MKFNKIFFACLIATAFAACSQDEESGWPEQPENGGKSVIIGANSDVEIRLSQSVVTRSSVETDTATGLFTVNGLGIFMLATDYTTTNWDEHVINWNPYINQFAARLDNEKANINNDGGTNNIVWDKDTTYYYPIDNWYAYRFFGYYPYTENVGQLASQRVVHYTDFDGTQDIIWGQSTRAAQEGEANYDTEKYRYSAKYFRQAGKANALPSIAFEHKLMRFQFHIQGIKDDNAEAGHEYDSANKMSIDTIIVTNVPSHLDLIAADYNNALNSGSLNPDWNNYLIDRAVLGDNDGEFVKEQVNGANVIKVGQPILLPVPTQTMVENEGFKYRVIIRLRDNQNKVYEGAYPIDINPVYQYKPGYNYNVVIGIAGPQAVWIKATLQAWRDADEEYGAGTMVPLELN